MENTFYRNIKTLILDLCFRKNKSLREAQTRELRHIIFLMS